MVTNVVNRRTIYTPVLTTSSSTLKTNLISFWELEQNSTPWINSVVASGNDLTSAFTDPTRVTGKVGFGQEFTTAAGGPLLLHGTNASLETGDIDFSVAFWVKLLGTLPTADALLVDKGTSLPAEYRVQFDHTNNAFFFQIFDASNATNTANSTPSQVSLGNWYFVACVCDKTNSLVKISTNGATFITTPKTITMSTSTNDFRLGDHDFLTDGVLDQIGFWKKALTQSEVIQLYNSGNGLSYAAM